jgi:ABC-type polysaccharide transport system permease subunit
MTSTTILAYVLNHRISHRVNFAQFADFLRHIRVFSVVQNTVALNVFKLTKKLGNFNFLKA